MSKPQQHETVDRLITDVIVAAGHLASCKMRESEFASARPRVKSEAIARLMDSVDPQKNKPYSATSAGELVGNDLVFAMHEKDQREATAATIRAMGEYEAAKLRAEFAVKGADLDIVREEPMLLGLGKDHTVQVGG